MKESTLFSLRDNSAIMYTTLCIRPFQRSYRI